MKGHVRKRAASWSYVIDLGNQRAQRCSECGSRYWIEKRPIEACLKCGGALLERTERRQREKSGFRTKADADRDMRAVLTTLDKGTYIEPAKLTVRDYLMDEWLPGITDLKPSTLLGYKVHVETHLVPELGMHRLQKLTASQINAAYARLLLKPKPFAKDVVEDGKPTIPAATLSPTTVRHIHVTLHRALRDAMKNGLISRNPADAASPPRTSTTKEDMKTWSADEVRAFLMGTRATRLYPLWVLLLNTGMRRGEALGLRWSDLDLEAGRMSIVQNRVAVGYEVHIGSPKTKRSRRNLPLNPGTVAALKEFHQKQHEEQLLWKQAGYTDTGLVFVQENGQPFHPDRISKMFDAAVAKSKQPRIRLHDLRHTYATQSLAAGVQAKTVSDLMGHANIGITIDTYSHAIPALEDAAATAVGDLFMPVLKAL